MRERRIRTPWLPLSMALILSSLSIWTSFGFTEQGQPSPVGDWSVFLPNDAAKQLVADSCFNCHDLERVVKLRGDHEFWIELISSMLTNGAQFSNDDMEKMSKYLSIYLGPDQERLRVPININTADPKLLRLLSPISGQVDQIVQAREHGKKFDSPEDLLKVDGITKEKVEKIKPFISVQ